MAKAIVINHGIVDHEADCGVIIRGKLIMTGAEHTFVRDGYPEEFKAAIKEHEDKGYEIVWRC